MKRDGIDEWGSELEISFRFLHLSLESARRLEKLHRAVTVKKHKRDGDLGAYFTLDENLDYNWLQEFIEEEKIPGTEFDIFVSLVTEDDTWIVEVPSFVVVLVRQIGGRITFSCTTV